MWQIAQNFQVCLWDTSSETRGVYRTANKAPKTLLRRIFAGNLEDVKTSPFAGMCTEAAMRADRAS